MDMKQSLFLLNFSPAFENGLTLEQALSFAKESGFSGVEPANIGNFSTPDTKEAEKFARCCSNMGLEIPCFSMHVNLLDEDYRKRVELLCRYIDVAYAMGTKVFHHTIAPELEHLENIPLYEEIKSQIVEAASEALRYAAKYGITCVYENQGFLVNGIRNYTDFFTSLSEKNKGVVLDTGNILFVDEKPENFAAHFLNKIAHVHVKDYIVKNGSAQFPGKGWYIGKNGDFLRGTIVGHGAVNFIQIFKMLQRVGYDGWYSLEFDGMEDLRTAMRLSRENMSYYYKEAQRQLQCEN